MTVIVLWKWTTHKTSATLEGLPKSKQLISLPSAVRLRIEDVQRVLQAIADSSKSALVS